MSAFEVAVIFCLILIALTLFAIGNAIFALRSVLARIAQKLDLLNELSRIRISATQDTAQMRLAIQRIGRELETIRTNKKMGEKSEYSRFFD